jgi:diaminopimelate epimerase
MAIPFIKFHGFGNDYIVMHRSAIGRGRDLGELARGVCDRHRGAGSDGIAVLDTLDGTEADYFCEIVNPDGSIAGFSGNGTRCSVASLYHGGLWSEPTLRLKTRSGVKIYTLIDRPSGTEFWFDAEIGEPRFDSASIPVVVPTPAESVLDEPVTVDGVEYRVSAVSVGNPVACVFVDNYDFDWRAAGSDLETHEIFPEKANIVFVRPIDRDNIEIRIWERAAGETSSSGTCSSGAAVLSAFTRRTNRSVNVYAPGGITRVVWREDGEMVINGRADLAYSGQWPDQPISEIS